MRLWRLQTSIICSRQLGFGRPYVEFGQIVPGCKGDTLDVEKLDAEVDSEITFSEVLLRGEGDSVTIGAPFIEGGKVTAKVVDQFRDVKGIAFKFKRRKGFHKTKGFRRHLTKLEITSIA